MSFFDGIFEFFGTILQYVITWFSSLYHTFVLLALALDIPLLFYEIMPPIIGVSITIVVSIGVVKFLVGR